MKRVYLIGAVWALSSMPALAGGGGADGYAISQELHGLIRRLIELLTG